MKKVLWASVALGACSAAHAQLFAYDDFSAVGSGTGWEAASSWSAPITLTSANPLGPGLGQYAQNGDFGESFRRISATAKAAVDARTAGGNSFWVGFLIRWNGPTGPGAQNYGGVQLRQGATGTGSKRMFMGSIWEKNNWGVGTQGDTVDVESSVAIGADPVFLSYEVNLSTHLGTMYVNNVAAVTNYSLDSATTFFTTLDVLKIEAGSGANQRVAVDELRIGATKADVQLVPEPATMAALGLGALALIRRRRK